jgi:uncharacterized membrane protein SpoIIM required for sporulation
MIDRYLTNSVGLILFCLSVGIVCGWLSPTISVPSVDPWDHTQQLHSQGWLTASRLHFLVYILRHNIFVLVILCASSIVSGGLASVLYFLVEGINLGRTLQLSSAAPGGLAAVLLLVTPHGVIEMSAFVLAGASTLSAGTHFFRTILGKSEIESWPKIRITLLRMYGLSLGLVVSGAIVEAYITPEFGILMRDIFSLQ